jgi:hypothetical protein
LSQHSHQLETNHLIYYKKVTDIADTAIRNAVMGINAPSLRCSKTGNLATGNKLH